MNNNHIWTVILAAGASRRFKGIKALAPFGQGSFISNACAIARKFTGKNVVVVTGAHRDEIEPALAGHQIAYNADWEKGMGTSLACGLRAVMAADAKAEAVVIMPVDQPHIHLEHLQKLVDKALTSGLCTLSSDGAVDTPPAALVPEFFKDALALTGDRGLKASLTKYNVVVDPAVTQDIDTKM